MSEQTDARLLHVGVLRPLLLLESRRVLQLIVLGLAALHSFTRVMHVLDLAVEATDGLQ